MVGVGGFPVYTDVQGSIALVMKECVQEWELAILLLLHCKCDGRTNAV